jgi:transcriptional regulator with XRE-family HTH domain
VAKEKIIKSCPLAQRLASIMRERRLKHRELAEAVGVSKAAVGKWLRGTTPGAGELFRLSKFFEKPMEWFMEAIPYTEQQGKALNLLSPGQVPVNFISPELRKFYAAMFEAVNTPEGVKGLQETFRRLARSATRPRHAPKESSKQGLTVIDEYVNLTPMTSPLVNLLERVRKATASEGMKSELAKLLGVPPSALSHWLSGRRQPGGETALKLLQWVEQQEAHQNKSPGSVQPPPGPKTQLGNSNEKKTESGPPKS